MQYVFLHSGELNQTKVSAKDSRELASCYTHFMERNDLVLKQNIKIPQKLLADLSISQGVLNELLIPKVYDNNSAGFE
jgi:hypothetical protein